MKLSKLNKDKYKLSLETGEVFEGTGRTILGTLLHQGAEPIDAINTLKELSTTDLSAAYFASVSIRGHKLGVMYKKKE